MAVFRVVSSLVSASSIRLTLASYPFYFLPQVFHHASRTFTSDNSVQTSSIRKMQTSTAYQPHKMAPLVPTNPIRKKPDLSSFKSASHINEIEAMEQSDQNLTSIEMPQIEKASYGPTKETNTDITTDGNTSAPHIAKSRPRLRARKAAIKLTPSAVNHLRALLDRPSPKLIKVGVRNRGCSGLAYHLEYVDKVGKLDEEVVQDGVTLVIDSKALFSIIGSEMDWVEDNLSQKFVFKNPNIKEQCGCGESFMV